MISRLMRKPLGVFAGVLVSLLLAPSVAAAADVKIEKENQGSRSRIELRFDAPSFGAQPRGYIYEGPLPPPYPYYYPPPYPYYGYPAPQGAPSPGMPQVPAPTQSAPPQYSVGHLIIVVDPVGAEVSLDGLRLTQRPDLSYAVGVLEGRHEVRVTASGFEPHARTLDVRPGIGMFLTVRLVPVGAEKKTP